jgi:hypothetical protein
VATQMVSSRAGVESRVVNLSRSPLGFFGSVKVWVKLSMREAQRTLQRKKTEKAHGYNERSEDGASCWLCLGSPFCSRSKYCPKSLNQIPSSLHRL